MPPRRTPGSQAPGVRSVPAGRPGSGRARSAAGGRSEGGHGGARAEPVRALRAQSARGGRGGREPARPTATRPPSARRAGPAGATTRTPAPSQRRITGRAAVLATVLLGLLLAYAYPVRVYLAQQAEIAALEQEQAQQRRRIGQLIEERAKWDDEEYVKAQARTHLHYVLPGETPYFVLDDATPPADPDAAPPAGAALKPDPWYGKLWASIAAADHPPSP